MPRKQRKLIVACGSDVRQVLEPFSFSGDAPVYSVVGVLQPGLQGEVLGWDYTVCTAVVIWWDSAVCTAVVLGWQWGDTMVVLGWY